jgi:hypothetical protein
MMIQEQGSLLGVVPDACAVVTNPLVQAAARLNTKAAQAQAAAAAACAILAPPPVQPVAQPAASQASRTFTPIQPMRPAGRGFPAGTVTAFSTKRGGWRIAVPIGMGGEATHVETAPSPQAPEGVPQVSEGELETKTGTAPWYKSWKLWAAVGGGIVVVGTTGYFIFRKKGRR